jgi:amino acid transporter
VTVGEARNPRRAVPRAIRRVFFRIVAFYICGILVISLIVPYNDPRLLSGSGNAASSPFTIAISNAGIKVLPSIVNGVVLVAAWSAANSDVVSFSALPFPGRYTELILLPRISTPHPELYSRFPSRARPPRSLGNVPQEDSRFTPRP